MFYLKQKTEYERRISEWSSDVCSSDLGPITTRCLASAGELACAGRPRVRCLVARTVSVIRIDQIWLAVEPVDMRSGMDRLLARVVEIFGASQPHHAYVFANRRGTRLKVLVCDGFRSEEHTSELQSLMRI